MVLWPPLEKIIPKKSDAERYFQEMARFFLTPAATVMFVVGVFFAFCIAVIGHLGRF